MPPRNTREQLARLQALCRKYEFMEISGVDINQPRQSFRCPELLLPEFRHLDDATWAMVAHEALSGLDPRYGLFLKKIHSRACRFPTEFITTQPQDGLSTFENLVHLKASRTFILGERAMNIIVNPVSLAPFVRGFMLSLADYSCMVQCIETSSAHTAASVFRNAQLEEFSLSVDQLTPEARMDDGTVARLLKQAFEPIAPQARESLGKGAIGLSISNTKGECIANYKIVPLAPLNSRLRLAAYQPGDPELLPSSARSEVVKGKIAFVTGGAQGFGAEIARGLAHSGAAVWIADINLAGATRFAEELRAEVGSPTIFAVAIDVSNEESTRLAFDTVAETCGGLDLVISNAGILRAGSVLEQPIKEFRMVNEVNYIGFSMSRNNLRVFCDANGLELQNGIRHHTNQLQVRSRRIE